MESLEELLPSSEPLVPAVTSLDPLDEIRRREIRGGGPVTPGWMLVKVDNQTARFVNELFEDQDFSGGFRGTLEIRSDAEGIVSMGLLMTEGLLTSLPAHHFGRWTN